MFYDDQPPKNPDSEPMDFLRSFTQTHGISSRTPSEKDLRAFCSSHPSMKPVWRFLNNLAAQKQAPSKRSSTTDSKNALMPTDADEYTENLLRPPKEKRTKGRRARCRELQDSINLLEQRVKALARDISAKSQSKVDEETKREASLTSLLAWGGYACALSQRTQTIAMMKDSFARLNAAQESAFRPDVLNKARKSMQDILIGSELLETPGEKALIMWKMRVRKDCSDKFRRAMRADDENIDLLDVCGCNANINKFICTMEQGCKPDTRDFDMESAVESVLKRLGFTRTPGLSYEGEIQKIFAERLEKEKRAREDAQSCRGATTTESDTEGKDILDIIGTDPPKLMAALRICRKHAAALDSKVKELSPYVTAYENVGGVRVALKELNESRAALIKCLAQIVSEELSRISAVKRSVVKMEGRTLIPKIQTAIGSIESFSRLSAPLYVISSLESMDWLSWTHLDGRRPLSYALVNSKSLASEVPPVDFVGWDARLVRAERGKAFQVAFSDKSLDSLVATARDTIMCCEKHDKEVVRGKWHMVLETLVEDILENGEGRMYKKVMQLHNEWQGSPGAFCLSWVTVDGLTFSQWLSCWKEKCLQSRRRV